MQNYDAYDAVIFDCDGVILDSNSMKVNAMERALSASEFEKDRIGLAVEYFRGNFGKSRYHHVDYFVDELSSDVDDKQGLKEAILSLFAAEVEKGYLQAPEAPGISWLLKVSAETKSLFVASGSEEVQLNRILQQRGFDKYFKQILGSPVKKSENVKEILAAGFKKVLFIGDAVADYEAANENEIDFLFYAPYSNVKERMMELSAQKRFPVIQDFKELSCAEL